MRIVYTLRWVFKNTHEWSKAFDTEQEAQTHANMCGLYTHPDVVHVEIVKQFH